ncbi:MAG: DUF3168 domain-containing protein [Novosphingobium sp.]
MKAVAALRSLLLADTSVTAKREGGVNVNANPQNDSLPNVQLMLVSGLEDFTHSGPSGLIEDRVRVWCRGRTANAAADLAGAVHSALHGYVGTAAGCHIQLCRASMTISDYQDKAEVHRVIIDFNVSWSMS